jgi:hypothetical protein
MSRNRLFNLSIAIALVIALAITAREALATSSITSGVHALRLCDSLPSRHSIRSEYVPEANMWIVRTEAAPTGVDGGLMDLLSKYRDCSR